ncbi:ribosome hibernation-promoting factor, HPF/YfiA family [Mycolicibacter sinensis]|jgi:ribosomal subunit interface protein|uniref:Ribosome hibernation promoting factor n=1 Tax=Mycolicibacter sinensis (strain JDM601) TaxID=875328 RepID=A0A1A2DT76_MYCSD|nr:ribosome-associated translation inhibitor RaiA [Mycolicibacter sinensis]OBF95488.1 ribosomal subunit interface protein [Mycolicibacter sinensis]OBG01894.1 ribosomal subunit interface protein [Mycolicibacter sinensis]
MVSQFVGTSRTPVDADESPDQAGAEIVVKGRNVEIPDHFRVYVSQKLARLERLDRSIRLFDVELKHANNRRQRKSCQQIDITAHGRGPVVRGEARANSFYAAFEAAIDRLESRLRRGKGRRNVSYGDKTPVSVAEATAPDPEFLAAAFNRDGIAEPDRDGSGHTDGALHDGHDYEPGRIVRTKEHSATPMSVDDALYEMELVGHDFFLFHDKETDQPSVVYRRHAYDYGLIRLV